MEDKIFSSWLKLNFFRKEIEDDYQKQKEKKIYYYNEYVILFSFAFSIGATILNSLFIEYSRFTLFKTILIFTYVVQAIYIGIASISFFSTNIKVLRWIHLINYLLIYFNTNNFRFTIIRIVNSGSVYYYLMLVIEVMMRLVWNLIGLQSFLESFILNGIWIILIWIIFPAAYLEEIYYSNAMLNYMVYTLTTIFIICFSYVLERQQKNAYYFHWTLNKKAIWLTNVLETMNAGFLSIKGNKVVYINSYMKNQITKIKVNDKIQEVCENKNYSENDIDLKKLIAEFKAELNSQTSQEDFIKTFTKYISKIPDIKNFKLIGDKVVELEDSELSIEIQCRYTKLETEGDELEILFNDVTRTKLKEKENAEFKYKTVFLSKVAHEIKNPLICISELVDQINDDMKTQSIQKNRISNNSQKAFRQIKSLSNFLLILVRDLNFFSESQLGKTPPIEKLQTNLEEVINFCRMITESLIHKNNKSQSLKFLSIINDNVPSTIITDHWRLKQVLINLLSNSVKFTLFGQIVLEVSLEKINDNEKIKFLVKDTGVGIKEEQQKKLFVPFFKEFNDYNNKMGSGLGLNIANEIAKKLGGENIKFYSEYEKGSSFWFYIDNSPPYEHTFNINLSNKMDNKNTIIVEPSLDHKQIFLDEQNDKINFVDLILNSSYKTEQKEFDPSKAKQNTEDLIKEMTINIDEISSSSSQKSQPINFKKKLPEITDSSNAVISTKDDINYPIRVLDFLVKDLTRMRKIEKNEEEISSLIDFINVIVVDDEPMTRQSIIRILNNVSNELNIKINIIEAEDGVESIYIIYKAYTQGIKISLIFSDETMNFMNGSRSSEIINEILQKKNIKDISFYLVTAFEENLIKKFVSPSIKMILTKPLSKEVAKKLISDKAGILI